MIWCVAQTYGAQERKAIENLQRQDFEAFCPLLVKPSKSDIRKLVEVPLFPCYIFVKIDLSQRWQSINSTIGVIRLLTDRNSINPRPISVHKDKMNEILALSKAAEDPFPSGTVVRVRNKSNPFYDIEGTVISLSKLMRVSVMMSVFNRDVIVEFVDPSDLEKL